MELILLPAVDVVGGRVARSDANDPLAAARAYVAQGAAWLHLVDMDAAMGRGTNAELLAAVVRGLDADVELSGGIRDDERLRWAMSTGATRVVLSSDALVTSDWCERVCAQYGDRVAVAVDVRAGRVTARGLDVTGGPLEEALARLRAAGCARVVVADADRDGSLAGPDLGLLRACADPAGPAVIASGGISSLADLEKIAALTPLGVEGAIVGRALHAGAFTLSEALAAVARPR